jgi:hypothetical protein
MEPEILEEDGSNHGYQPNIYIRMIINQHDFIQIMNKSSSIF